MDSVLPPRLKPLSSTTFFEMVVNLEDSENDEGVMHNLIPCSTSADEVQVIDVEMQMLSFWEKTEVYLKMISVPLIIVAVTVVGFLLHFFKEIIIPTILALFLFQVSKPIVLRLHKNIIPYYWYTFEDIPENEQLLDENLKVFDLVYHKLYIETQSLETLLG